MAYSWDTPPKPEGLDMYTVPDGVIFKWQHIHGSGMKMILDYNIQILKSTNLLWSQSKTYSTKKNYLKIKLAYGQYQIRVRGRSRLGIGDSSDILEVAISNSAAAKCCHCKKNFQADSLSSHQKKCIDRHDNLKTFRAFNKLKLFDEHECQQERPEERPNICQYKDQIPRTNQADGTKRNYPKNETMEEDYRWIKFKKSFEREKEEKRQRQSEPTRETAPAFANNYDVKNEVHCPGISSVDHSRVMSIDGSRMHSRARFACLEGFEINGPDQITCLPSGQWSEEAPHCKGYERRIESVTAKSKDAIEMLKLEINTKTGMNANFKEAIIRLKENQRRLINDEDDLKKAISLINGIKKKIYDLKEQLKHVSDENANLRAEIEELVQDIQKRLDDHELKIQRFMNGPVTELENLLEMLDF